MGVSKNRGENPPKWMVKIMIPNPIKMDDLGVPLFLETPILKEGTSSKESNVPVSSECFLRSAISVLLFHDVNLWPSLGKF